MSKWGARKSRLKAESDYDPLTSMPMLEYGFVDVKQARRRIAKAFKDINAKNIVIIDPYFLVSDIEIIVDLFANLQDRDITVITFLTQAKVEDLKNTKLEAAIALQEIIEEIEEKGVFKSFQIIKTPFNFHDRFFVSMDEGRDNLVLSSGGSLSMLLNDYSCLIRVENRAFKRSIFEFIDKAKKNGSSLNKFIEQNT